MKAVENVLADVHVAYVAVGGEEPAAGACFTSFLFAAISASSSLSSLSTLSGSLYSSHSLSDLKDSLITLQWLPSTRTDGSLSSWNANTYPKPT